MSAAPASLEWLTVAAVPNAMAPAPPRSLAADSSSFASRMTASVSKAASTVRMLLVDPVVAAAMAAVSPAAAQVPQRSNRPQWGWATNNSTLRNIALGAVAG